MKTTATTTKSFRTSLSSSPRMMMFLLLLVSLIGVVPKCSCWMPPATTRTLTAMRTAPTTVLKLSSSSSSQEDGQQGPAAKEEDMTGKTLYQRIFYRLSPGSEVDDHKSMVVEERVRFIPDTDPSKASEGYVQPTGHRTLILRDGNVEDGEIGDDFFKFDIHEHSIIDATLPASIATAIYLASNPSLVCCNGCDTVMEVSCDLGLAGLLGTIGANYVMTSKSKTKNQQDDASKQHDLEDDVLTVPHDNDNVFPKSLKMLSLTDIDETNLDLACDNVKNSGVLPSKIEIQKFDWRVQHLPLLERRTAGLTKEYHTIIASDVDFSYPEAKQLAKTVAYRLKPSRTATSSSSSSSSPGDTMEGYTTALPTFVHVCPEQREDVTYLHKLLGDGYRMTCRTGYLKLEKLTFVVQALKTGESESKLDDMELEVRQFNELPYQSLTAVHSYEYYGEGTGEMFFPMDTGEYENAGGSNAATGATYMERDDGRFGEGEPWYSS